MEFITTPYTIEDITKLAKVGVNGIIISNPFFSARGAAYFSVDDLSSIREVTTTFSMKMYVMVNRFFMEEELDALRKHLTYLKELDVDGIYYGDEGVLYEAKMLHMEEKLIYNPDTLITNKEDVQYYLDEGIKMVTISKEITLEEICHIAKSVQGNCEVIVHGRLNMMHSKRQLLTNYLDFIGKSEQIKDEHDLYIKEENREEHMPIVEDDLGTHVFTGFTLSSFDELLDLEEAGVEAVRIDGIFQNIAYVCEVVRLYKEVLHHQRNGRKTYEEFKARYPQDNVTHGFYYTKTSKVK